MEDGGTRCCSYRSSHKANKTPLPELFAASANMDRAGVDQYTGAPLGERDDGQANLDGPIRESDLLPEERFHRADLISRHMIDTREKQRKDKVFAFLPARWS